MDPEAITRAATILLRARSEHRHLSALPEDCRPATVEDGYQVQRTLAREWGLDLAGWKVACTAKDQQRLLKVSEPFCGRIFVPFLFTSPIELPAGNFHGLGLEAEFAFRLGRDLPRKRKPYTEKGVARAVETMYPALEIVSPRYQSWLEVGAPSLVADNAVNGGLVVGAGIDKWKGFDLAAQPVRLEINGETVAKGSGKKVLGHPLNALVWLANHRAEAGDPLLAGQTVTTGTCTGIIFAQPGDEVRADFGEVGEVRIKFRK